MAIFKRKDKMVATNEFDQVIVGTSLTKEAWKRLRKNKLAVLGGIIVIILQGRPVTSCLSRR